MRLSATILAAATLLAGCLDEAPSDHAGAGSSGWRPKPLTDVPEPSEVVAKAPAGAWRAIAPENLLVIDLKDGGRVLIELAPAFAPVHVANVRAFARAGWWNGAAIYRVQDNYVAQWGNGDAKTALPQGVVRRPAAEYDRPLQGLDIRPLGYPDSYAPMVGHAGSWPVGYDPDAGRAWLTHCYGIVGVGRELAPDTGTGGELYAIIGHAPRHLDLNIAVIGRVVEGIELLSARPRGTEALGFYKDPAQHVPIAQVRLASDMPAAQRPALEVLRSDQDSFGQFVAGRANRGGEFFGRPAGGVDLCNVPVPVRRQAAG
ncbi:peptidylprolyl isomerase [Sphingosinicella sp. BN140058]|uniref:peptidylprolyl isomerase n=1 Tax=Sphingosinicella sp. BN140058 TaxID=1892855 RepID=UPI00101154FF|nr:peptidylprolyl isomerase [Sphingosinicella sp. BN140058]QAY77017.1 peptidylprolyl isomerase [Sphingosinicella sp. BN140058]